MHDRVRRGAEEGADDGGTCTDSVLVTALAATDGRWLVEARGLTKRFGRLGGSRKLNRARQAETVQISAAVDRPQCGHQQNVATNNVDLCIPPGCTFGYLGPNGADKTTVIRVSLGLTHSDAGSMSLLGYPVPAHRDARRYLGLCDSLRQLIGEYSRCRIGLSNGSEELFSDRGVATDLSRAPAGSTRGLADGCPPEHGEWR